MAVRLALVHEFRTRSRIFISTEAGAKGLNLQFCDTIVNYDLPWNPQRIEQRIGRCHRYGQEHDVTVVNFLAADNEAQRLTFEILSRKLDLFGKVLDASDAVLHEPTTDTPETLAGAVGSDFEGRLRRIYERARTVGEIEAELRRLREQMEDERKRFEETWARTAGRIETRFDQRVRQVFHRLQADLPSGLARLDSGDRSFDHGLLARSRRRVPSSRGEWKHPVRGFPFGATADGWRDGGTAAIGEARDFEDAEYLHLGHPVGPGRCSRSPRRDAQRLASSLVNRHQRTPRSSTTRANEERLVVIRIRYDGFERVDRLIPIAVAEGEFSPLAIDSARWLLDRTPHDRPELPSLSFESGVVDDLLEELVFTDQIEVACDEQRPFERKLEQIERYVEDQLMVLRRRLRVVERVIEHSGRQARSRARGRPSQSGRITSPRNTRRG